MADSATNTIPPIEQLFAFIETNGAEIKAMEAAERNSRSPLNPNYKPRYASWGVSGNAASLTTMMGA